MRKLTSVLLVLLLVVSMCCVAATNVAAQGAADLPPHSEDTYRYYFLAPDEWLETNGVAGIYYWPPEVGAWPGVEANKVDGYDNLFYYDVPKEVPTIIWNAFVDAGTAENPTPDAPYAFQTFNLGVEYLEKGEDPKWPNGRDSYDGLLYVIDMEAAPEFNEYGGATQWVGEWCDFDPATGKIDNNMTIEEYIETMYAPFHPTQPERPTTAPTDPSSEPTSQPTTGPTDVTEPSSETTAPTAPSTAPTDKPTTPSALTINGKTVYTGDQITYTAYLKANEISAGLNVHVNYDGDLLKVSDETKALKKKDVIPVAYTGSSVLNFEPIDKSSQVLFNSNDIDEGYDFTGDNAILITLKFDVIGTSGSGKITTELVEFLGMTDKDNQNFPITDYVLTDETIVPDHPDQPTQPSSQPTQPSSQPTQPVEHTYNVAGEKTLTGFEWVASENAMTKGEDGIWTIVFKDVPAGTYAWKVCEDGKFDVTYNEEGLTGDGNPGNAVITTSEVSDITITFNEETKLAYADSPYRVIITDHTYTIAGNADLCGSNWSASDTNNDMTEISDGVFQKVYTGVEIGAYEFKIAQDHSWGVSYGDPTDPNKNLSVIVDEDNSTVTITFTEETKEIKVEVTAGEEPTQPSSDASEPTQPSSDASEPTEPSSDVTEPTEPTTDVTEPSTGGTDPTQAPTNAPTSAPTQAPTNGGTPGGDTGKVATGDSTSVAMLLGILMLAAGAVVLARKKVRG